MIVGLVIGLVLGAGGGGVVAWALASACASARVATDRERHAEALGAARAEVLSLQAALEVERGAAEERRGAADEVRRQLVGEFAELSRQALEQNNTQFLELADVRLSHAQHAARGDLDQRTQAIEQLLTPLRDQLGRYEDGLRLLELERQKAYTGLSEQVRSLTVSQDKLQSETRNLVTALRSPATRGRWGEMQLRRVVEMAGMVEHCDFEQQVTTDGPDGRLRPDMVVALHGARQVVVDAKVPLQAFLDANDATNEADRKAHLVVHAAAPPCPCRRVVEEGVLGPVRELARVRRGLHPRRRPAGRRLRARLLAPRARPVPSGPAGHAHHVDRLAAHRGLGMAARGAGRERPRGAGHGA